MSDAPDFTDDTNRVMGVSVKPERLRAHEYDEDAVCIHCGFDGAEHAHLNSVRLNHDPEPIPPCMPWREEDLAASLRCWGSE